MLTENSRDKGIQIDLLADIYFKIMSIIQIFESSDLRSDNSEFNTQTMWELVVELFSLKSIIAFSNPFYCDKK